MIIMFSNVTNRALSWEIACYYISDQKRGENTKQNKKNQAGFNVYMEQL